MCQHDTATRQALWERKSDRGVVWSDVVLAVASSSMASLSKMSHTMEYMVDIKSVRGMVIAAAARGRAPMFPPSGGHFGLQS